MLIGELVVPLAFDLVECWCGNSLNASTLAQLVERFSGLAIAAKLHKRLSLDEQHFGVTNLDAVNRVVRNLNILSVFVTLVNALAVDWRIDRRVVIVGFAVFGVHNFGEVGFGQTLVVGLLSKPVVVKVVVRNFGVVLAVAAAVLAVLERECPRAVCLVVALSVKLVAVVGNGEQMLVGAAFVALILASPEFVVFGVQSQFSARNHLVSIFDGLLKTSVGFAESRVGLRCRDGSHLAL